MRVRRINQVMPDGGWRALRVIAPLLLVPLGMVYCHIRGFFDQGHWAPPLDSAGWAAATLLPWSVAVTVFLQLVRPQDTKRRAILHALALAVPAYLLSGVAALLVGSDSEGAFYTRLPGLAVAMLAAALYADRRAPTQTVPATDGEQDLPLTPHEIVFASAAGNYVELHGAGRSTVWRQTMRNAEQILKPAGFVRVHRRYLVPRRSIQTIERDRKGPVEIALHNGHRLPVSDSYAANLRD